ncbi:hypothetical protein MRX96_041499 [Rhipicephalus microplus]
MRSTTVIEAPEGKGEKSRQVISETLGTQSATASANPSHSVLHPDTRYTQNRQSEALRPLSTSGPIIGPGTCDTGYTGAPREVSSSGEAARCVPPRPFDEARELQMCGNEHTVGAGPYAWRSDLRGRLVARQE